VATAWHHRPAQTGKAICPISGIKVAAVAGFCASVKGSAILGIGLSIKTSCAEALCLFFYSLPLFFLGFSGNVGGVVELNFRRGPLDIWGFTY
jgi:hypothetical protein